MADPTGTVDWKYSVTGSIERHELVISNNEPLVRGGFASLDLGTGTVEFSADDAQHVFAGLVVQATSGQAEDLTGDGATKKVSIVGGVVLEKTAVTGATAITDVGDFVYAADGQTLTKTAGSNNRPCGYITQWHNETTCDVRLFNLTESRLYAATVN